MIVIGAGAGADRVTVKTSGVNPLSPSFTEGLFTLTTGGSGTGVKVGVAVGGTGVKVGVAVGGTGVSVGVAVGNAGVKVGVAVGGTGVSVGVAVAGGGSGRFVGVFVGGTGVKVSVGVAVGSSGVNVSVGDAVFVGGTGVRVAVAVGLMISKVGDGDGRTTVDVAVAMGCSGVNGGVAEGSSAISVAVVVGGASVAVAVAGGGGGIVTNVGVTVLIGPLRVGVAGAVRVANGVMLGAAVSVDVAVAPGITTSVSGVLLGWPPPATAVVGVAVRVLVGAPPTPVVAVNVGVGGIICATGGPTSITGATAGLPGAGALIGVWVRRATSVARKFGKSGSGAAKLRSPGKGTYGPRPIWAATSLKGSLYGLIDQSARLAIKPVGHRASNNASKISQGRLSRRRRCRVVGLGDCEGLLMRLYQGNGECTAGTGRAFNLDGAALAFDELTRNRQT